MGWRLHRGIGALMRPLRGYWPLMIWLTSDLVSSSLYVWAGMRVSGGINEEFLWFFALIGTWSTLRLAYEYWFCGWAFLWLFRKDRLENLYRHVEMATVNFTRSAHVGRIVDVWMRKKVYAIRQFGPQFRKKFTMRARIVGYVPLFGYGLLPLLPKFPTIALCRTLRWETGFLALAAGNVLRVGLTLGGVFGTGQVVRWITHALW